MEQGLASAERVGSRPLPSKAGAHSPEARGSTTLQDEPKLGTATTATPKEMCQLWILGQHVG